MIGTSLRFMVVFVVVSAVGTWLSPSASRADWSDNFDGGLQQPWFFGSFKEDGTPSPTFSAGSVNNRLVLTDPVGAFLGGAEISFGLVPTEIFTDVRISGVINPDGDDFINDTHLLFARGVLEDATFYGAELSYDDRQFAIWRSDSLTTGADLASVDLGDILFTDTFYIEFDVIGTELEARLFDTPGGSLLQTLNASDTTFAAGMSGVVIDQRDGILPLLGIWDDVSAVALVPAITGDFNGDGSYDCLDVDALVADIAAGSHTASFDLTGDGQVSQDDLAAWLAEAGAANLTSGASYLYGDANLDGSVDVSDFNVWNGAKFTSTPAWCDGDFNADGVVDVADFNLWNGNKFLSAAPSAIVPEPLSWALGAWLLPIWGLGRRRRISV